MVEYLFGRANVGDIFLVDPDKAESNTILLFEHFNHLLTLMEKYSPNVTSAEKRSWWKYCFNHDKVVVDDELYAVLKKHLSDMTVRDFIACDSNKCLSISSALARDLYANFENFKYEACCIVFDRIAALQVVFW